MNFQTRLAEITNDMKDNMLGIKHDIELPESMQLVQVHEYCEAIVELAQQQITELFLEIIGEDENEYITVGSVKYLGVRMGRNQLRNELRKAIDYE